MGGPRTHNKRLPEVMSKKIGNEVPLEAAFKSSDMPVKSTDEADVKAPDAKGCNKSPDLGKSGNLEKP